jgi:C1A family cysteine protease
MDLKELKAAIKKAKAKWLPDTGQRTAAPRTMGLVLESKRRAVKVAVPEQKSVRGGLPSKVDLSTLATPVRDQGGCGSCVAFATVGALELAINHKIGQRVPGLDLSEQQVFSCGGGKCATGWQISKGAAYLAKHGACDESAMPYVAMDLACKVKPTGSLAANWKDRIFKAAKAVQVRDVDWKLWLAAGHPVIFAMAVYGDFFRYKSGVYKHVLGDHSGYHAVTCVGYGPGYWLVRNSWGTGFGEGGYFRIYDKDVSIVAGSGWVVRI